MRKGRLSKGGGILTVQRIEIILATAYMDIGQGGVDESKEGLRTDTSKPYEINHISVYPRYGILPGLITIGMFLYSLY